MGNNAAANIYIGRVFVFCQRILFLYVEKKNFFYMCGAVCVDVWFSYTYLILFVYTRPYINWMDGRVVAIILYCFVATSR